MISDVEQSRSDIILEMENRFMFAGRRRLCVAPRADTSGPCGLVQSSILTVAVVMQGYTWDALTHTQDST